MKNFISIFLISIAINICAQSKKDVEIINELCSDKLCGRGYVNNGHLKAARFIRDNFKNLGLKQYKKGNYLQSFNINVNTFPNDLHITLDSIELTEGIDYHLSPISGSAKGSYKIIYLNKIDISEFLNFRNKENALVNNIVVISADKVKNTDSISFFNNLKYELAATYCPVIWLTEKKLTWSVGAQELQYPIIELNSSTLNNAKQISLDIKNVYRENLVCNNLIGFIEGKKQNKSIVISAHYDHLGMMGEAMFKGANDNASGVTMMLSFAEYFSKNKPKYNIVFMAFAAEEAGILGSKYYVENPWFPLEDIKFLLNLDLLGTGDQGICVVNGTLHKKTFKKLSKINKKQDLVSKIKIRGRAANSDHYWFSQRGIPAFFIYTLGGIKAYHDVYDLPQTLPLTEFNDVKTLLLKFIAKL